MDLEAKLAQWAEGILLALPVADTPEGAASNLEALAIDGKTLRGSARQGTPGTHLLSAFSHRLGLTLGQEAVNDKSNEISAMHWVPCSQCHAVGAMQWVLQGLILEGRVVTVDALLTQRAIAHSIVEKKGTI